MKWFTCPRVVPIIVSKCFLLISARIGSGEPTLPKLASSSTRARRFSVELNSWSIKSSSTRAFLAKMCEINICENAGSLRQSGRLSLLFLTEVFLCRGILKTRGYICQKENDRSGIEQFGMDNGVSV